MKTNKQISTEVYAKHLHLAETSSRQFRKTVMCELMELTGCSLAAAATYYNNCRKESASTDVSDKGIVVKSNRKASKNRSKEELQPDNECFSVLELMLNEAGETIVGRCQSFLMQGDASECFDSRVECFSDTNWILIQGLGPNHGDVYKLDIGEKEVKRYTSNADATEELSA